MNYIFEITNTLVSYCILKEIIGLSIPFVETDSVSPFEQVLLFLALFSSGFLSKKVL